MNTPATVLRNAALVVEHGWTRHTYTDRYTGNVCAMGAIHLASGASKLIDVRETSPYNYGVESIQGVGSTLADAAAAALSDELSVSRRGWHTSVTGWNDCTVACAADVAAMMRAAADRWEKWNRPAQPAPVRSELELAGGPIQ